MRIFVKVKPNAKEEKAAKIGKHAFEVWVHAPAADGKANAAAARVLAAHFGVASSRVRLVLGRTLREKLFEIS